MRLIVGAGGTGGGVYPALAVLQMLNHSGCEILWVGSEGGMESDLIQRAGYPYLSIPAAGLHGVGLLAMPGNFLRLFKGWLAARRIIKDFQPDILFFTGGYVSLPIAFAGRHIPSLVFMPDIEPGLAIKFISRYATRVAVTTADSLKHFDDKTKITITGYPTRQELKHWNREDARQKFSLKQEKRVILVFGGSQGAQSLNRALVPILPDLLDRFQVIHLCGRQNLEETQQERANLPVSLSEYYHLFPYLHAEELGAAFEAADLVVSRAGAAVLGEFPQFGLPAILVPYPHAWRYQQINAQYLENHGAAIVLQDSDLQRSLLHKIRDLFDHPEQLQSMGMAMRSLANPQAAACIARHLKDLGNSHSRSLGGPQ